jgi:molybdopterin molybdotransferase
VTQRIPAGTSGRPLEPGTAARIFTGAPIPKGSDAVVVQEVCEQRGEHVRIPGAIRPGANIRRAGEDIRSGGEVIARGTRLAPQHLGLAASVGVPELALYRRLKVAVFASGDELVMPGKPLGPGQIYNSNRFVLRGLLTAMGCEVLDLGIVADNLDATVASLSDAAERADLVLASGGVSVGEEDHVKPAVERLGSLDLWNVAIRPGKPLAFGHIGSRRTPFIGSPGNPVSLFVTFCLFARPFIQRMQGIAGDLVPRSLLVPAGFDFPRPAKRREFLRARLTTDGGGATEIEVYPSRSSGVLSSVAWADGLAVVHEGQRIRKGDKIPYIPFGELVA